MIGVIAHATDHAVVREFFELFKTPWEFYRQHRHYDVVLSAIEGTPGDVDAPLVVGYSAGTSVRASASGARMLSYKGRRLPIYGPSRTFERGADCLVDAAAQKAAATVAPSRGGVRVTIGYDLLREIGGLLRDGQPLANADIPALELHIQLLRDLIVEYAAPLVEIPPIPDGHRLIACLTHDVDHPALRRHTMDHTAVGFLYRALAGSVVDALRGRVPARRVLLNWLAALKLPLVHVGLAKDFWWAFDRYLVLEAGRPSTFFVIPFGGDPGRTADGPAPRRRAAAYGARDIADRIGQLASSGCEIGVHGLDAWCDSARGRDELQEIARISGVASIGVRMHWLYGGPQSPAILEKAGFAYDSTCGYNETVGYRAGTTQVFKPLEAIRLLELPLHVMDTALFYPAHLHCSPAEARRRLRAIIDNALQFGGAVTVNWHDRSLAPERLWGAPYVELLAELTRAKAWFAQAGQAVAWFAKRRSAAFDAVTQEPGRLRVNASADPTVGVPALRLRIHPARQPGRFGAIGGPPPARAVDLPLRATLAAAVST
jgi:hypothetical protein